MEKGITAGTYMNRVVVEYADNIAGRDEEREITYAELHRGGVRLANALLAAGAEPGDRVILLAPNSVGWLECDWGIVKGGFVRVAALERLHPAELAQIAADTEPVAAIVDAGWLAEHGHDWVPESTKLIGIGDEASLEEGITPFSEFRDNGGDDELPEVDPEALAWIMFTSGSTGLPKGVMATQRSIAAGWRNTVGELSSIAPGDVTFHTAPISHFSSSVMHATLAQGGTNVFRPSFELDEVIEAAEGGEVTVLPLVPTQITMLIEELGRRGDPRGKVGNVRLVPYAGSAIQPDRAERAREFFGEAMTQFYGASEAPLPITALHPADHRRDLGSGGLPLSASAGKPTENVEVKIVDEDERELPRGETGEIVVFGENVGPGYWRDQVATEEALKMGGVFTGDVGYIDDDGYLFILDRRKDMIVTGGFNVYPREVENVISKMPGVREVAVVGAPHPKWGEAITAVIALEPGAEVSADDVIEFCRQSVARFKVPRAVEFVDELPKSGVGKIQKNVIRDRLWEGLERRV